MKRIVKISIISMFILALLVGCASFDAEQNISDYNWEIEFVSDLEGNPLESDMDIEFDSDNNFVLKDKLNNKEWKGEYTSKKVDSSYKINLLFEDVEEAIIGVYGTRKNEDKTKVPMITFQFGDKIFCFLANE